MNNIRMIYIIEKDPPKEMPTEGAENNGENWVPAHLYLLVILL